MKVFDNLYFFGQSEYAVWAITTSDGIIVLDTISLIIQWKKRLSAG